jgi:hypothetical protein
MIRALLLTIEWVSSALVLGLLFQMKVFKSFAQQLLTRFPGVLQTLSWRSSSGCRRADHSSTWGFVPLPAALIATLPFAGLRLIKTTVLGSGDRD